MIRGRKEGTNYATWFIGFDHDDTFGLPAFPELPTQSPRSPVHNKSVSRATSLESLVPVGQSRDSQTVPKSLTPAATQTTTDFSQPIATQTTEETPTQTRTAFSQPISTQTTEETPTQTRTDFSQPIATQTRTDCSQPISTQTTEETSTQTRTDFSQPIATQTTEETPTQTRTDFSQPISTQTPKETPTQTLHQASTQTRTHTSNEVSTEAFDTTDSVRIQTPAHNHTRPKSQDFDAHVSRRRKEQDTQGLYKEAFDGAKKAEEFKFRVKFDKLISDLHVAIEEKTQNGQTSVVSPSYGEVMLTFKEKVKDLLKGFSQRLELAHESFGTDDSPESTGQKVRQNLSKFIEELIGETLDLTSDEAVSDLSSLSDDSASDQNSFEDLIAQAVVSKLLENHQKEVNETIRSSHHNGSNKNNFKDQGTDPQDILRLQRDSFTNYDYIERKQNLEDISSIEEHNNFYTKRSKDNDSRNHNGGIFNPELINQRSTFLPDDENESDRINFRSRNNEAKNEIISNPEYKNEETRHLFSGTSERNELYSSGNVHHISDEEIDIVKEFEQLKEFVKKTRTLAQKRVEAVPFDDSVLYEAKEETLMKTNIDRDEDREEFHTRYSVLDHINNWEPPLPDFSNFDKSEFDSDEIDPDLLSMNLAIIPEETEEELEQEEEEDEQNRWKVNWLFQGKGVSPYGNIGKRTVNVDDEGSLYMMVPRPGDHHTPKIGHRDIDQLSDFSDHDLLNRTDLDGSDDEENTYYANTSKELARISGRRKQSNNSQHLSSGSLSDNSDIDSNSPRRKSHNLFQGALLDDVDNMYITGPIVEPSRQELKLLEDLVPAENDDPKFVIAPESVTVQEGEPVKFTCKVAGSTPVDVFWYREGDEVEELDESEDVEITSNVDKHSVVLYNTSKAMAGQYMCIALNEKGKAIQYLVVTVKDNKQELKKPEFLKGLKDIEVTEGQSVKFRVKVKGFPPPRISWYKDGALLKSSKTCRIEKFGNRDYILTIDYASMNDDAEYTVSARNVAGNERLSAQVIVEPQSDLPTRRQRLSSNTTSDSDSDRSTPRRSLKASAGFSSSPAALPTPSKASVQDREDQLHINQLDRRVSLTQIQVEKEAEKMRGVAEKDEATEGRRLITSDTFDVLKAADEIIQLERSAALHPPHTIVNGENSSSPLKDSTNQNEASSTVSSTQDLSSDIPVKDLILPDTLDDFPLPNLKSTKSTPVISALELTLTERNQQNHISDRKLSSPGKLKPEINFQENSKNFDLTQPTTSSQSSLYKNQNDTNLSAVSSDVGREPTLSLPSSGISDTSSNEGEQTMLALVHSRQQLLREQYSRDFEVPQVTEKKRWSVTLDSFSPLAEVVNKQNTDKIADEGTNNVEISVADLSQSFSIRSLKGDNSSHESSRRQSTDSGVSVSSKQKRPAPVHMVGHTTEEEVPESRTEFNTDGSIELPSVNRLKAMFSNLQDEDLGNGNFKRIHSITARNVPKEQLEKLKAYNQNEISSSSGNFLEVPGSTSSPSLTNLSVKSNPSSSYNSFPKLTSTPVQSSADSVHQRKTFPVPSAGAYMDLDFEKDPVLIYPQTDPDYMQRHRSPSLTGEAVVLTKSSRSFLPPQQNEQQHGHQTYSAKPTKVTLNSSLQPQTKLVVRPAVVNDENENVKKSGPRIRSGCISARAAFWERRIVDGGVVDNEEFPEMVEDNDI